MKIFHILPKNPFQRWFFLFRRYGKKDHQDYAEQCKFVASILERNQDFKVLIATKFAHGSKAEMGVYLKKFAELGIPSDQIIEIHAGLETISQMILGSRITANIQADHVLVVAWIHSPRVRLLRSIFGTKAEIVVTGGYPRPWDVLMEVLFIPLYPILWIKPLRVGFQFLANGLRKLKGYLWGKYEQYEVVLTQYSIITFLFLRNI